MIRKIHTFEKAVITALILMMIIVVMFSTFRLGWKPAEKLMHSSHNGFRIKSGIKMIE